MFVTTWRLEAPIEPVWNVIHDLERWPTWWKGLECAVRLKPGDENGEGSVWRLTWKGPLAYRLAFDLCVTRVERPVALEGTARGELEGTGRWQLSHQGPVTRVGYIWTVHTTKNWMNWLAPLARPLFEWNHNLVMQQGAEGLARLLNARLLQFRGEEPEPTSSG